VASFRLLFAALSLWGITPAGLCEWYSDAPAAYAESIHRSAVAALDKIIADLIEAGNDPNGSIVGYWKENRALLDIGPNLLPRHSKQKIGGMK
jgi:hypothetical protein